VKSNFLLRLESQYKRVISDIINNELQKDIGLVTITSCDITSDLEYLTVYYTVLSKYDNKKAREGLEQVKGFIRSSIASRVKARKTPQLIFKLDDSYNQERHIEELLESLKK